MEKGVSSYSREPFLASKKRPLCVKDTFSYLAPVRLSPPFGGVGGGFPIRRGDGGEAVDGLVIGCGWTVVRLLLTCSR